MKAVKNINNNVAICVDDDNRELIAIGKGIGFQKVPHEVELSQIDQTYYNLDPHYVTLINEWSPELIDTVLKIVKKGSSHLGIQFNNTFWFSLCDHIHFAIENTKKGLVVSNPLSNEIAHLYPKEVLLGKWSVDYIHKQLGVKLPPSESFNIALHFINNSLEVREAGDRDPVERFIEDVTDIIESDLDIIIDRTDYEYSRFVTHLKYLLQRSSTLNESNSENESLYDEVYEEFPKLRSAIEKIKQYITAELGIEPSKEELLYLMMHLNRLCANKGL